MFVNFKQLFLSCVLYIVGIQFNHNRCLDRPPPLSTSELSSCFCRHRAHKLCANAVHLSLICRKRCDDTASSSALLCAHNIILRKPFCCPNNRYTAATRQPSNCVRLLTHSISSPECSGVVCMSACGRVTGYRHTCAAALRMCVARSLDVY